MKNEFYETRQFIRSFMDTFTPLTNEAFEETRLSLAQAKNQFMHYLADLALQTLPSNDKVYKFRKYQEAMVNLCNQIRQARDVGRLRHPQQQQLCSQAESGLLEILDHIAFEYPEHFDFGTTMPHIIAERQKEHARQTAAHSIALLETQGIPADFTAVLSTYFHSIDDIDHLTYSQSRYFQKICHELPGWMSHNRDESPVRTLHRLLCYYNFNRMDYLNFLSHEFLQQARTDQPAERRLYGLHEELGYWKNFISSAHWCYHPKNSRVSVLGHARQLLSNHIECVEKELTLNPGRRSTDYLIFERTPGQWSLALDHAMEKNAFGLKTSRRAVAVFLEEHVRTGDNRVLSAETLRRKDLPHKEQDVLALHQYHLDAAQWIEENNPQFFQNRR